MRVSSCCRGPVISLPASAGLHQAARLMREQQVGAVVVTEQRQGCEVAVGVIADRDLVTEVLATSIDVELVCLGDLVRESPLVAGENESLVAVIEKMSLAGLRRVPVVDSSGVLRGILSLDDVLQVLALQLNQVARLVAGRGLQNRSERVEGTAHGAQRPRQIR